jgi:hypothetical protein
MQNNIPTLYISEIHCCIVKNTKFSNIFVIFLQKNMKIFKNLKITVYAQHEPAFSVGQLRILHVKSCLENIGEGLLHRVPRTEVSLLRENRKIVFTAK